MPNCPVCNKPRIYQATIDKYGKCAECNAKKNLAIDKTPIILNPANNLPDEDKTYKKKTIPVVLREQVWRKYFKNSLDGLCPICTNKISFANHDCAHILAESQGGSTDITNLRPTCGKCNKSMGTMHLNDFKDKINPTAVTHAKRVNHKYLIFWSEIHDVYNYYDKGILDSEEKNMSEDDSYDVFVWDAIQEIFLVLLEKLNNNPDDPILKHKYSVMFIEYLLSHESLYNAVKYAPKRFKLQELIDNYETEFLAYKDIINRRYRELDKQYFKFNEIKLAKKIASNIKAVGNLSDYSGLVEDFDHIVRLFNSIWRDYFETVNEYHKYESKEKIKYLIKLPLILLETYTSVRITYRSQDEIVFIKSKKDLPLKSYIKEYINRINTSSIDYTDIGTFYTLMFTDSHPYIDEEKLKDILDLKNGYY